jgi:protocatechuate 3,4-dioxygenase beta subunit
MTNNGQQGQHDIYDLGLQADLAMWTRKPIERRGILKMGMLGIGVLLAGCGANAATPTAIASATATRAAASAAPSTAASASAAASPAASPSAATTTSTSAAALVDIDEIPQETAGPYPADGSHASNQTLNALTLSGIVRQDIRASLGTGKVAAGIPTTLELTFVDASGGAPLAGYAVYLWHCDRDGNYSLYSNGVTGEDYLRGVQVTDSSGKPSFTTIFPACYSGRWPHAHFEIYPSLEQATSAANAIHTTQLALPEDVCKAVYATEGYAKSISNLSRVTLESDNLFRDGHELQMATVTGDITSGYTARLTVGVDV